MTTKNKNTAKKKTTPKKPTKTSTHPMKGRDILVKALENEGVKVIFGYPGGASMEIHQGLALSKKIRMVLPRHEQGGAFAAGATHVQQVMWVYVWPLQDLAQQI